MDRPKIVFAGVDAGAKILVELTGCAAAIAAQHQIGASREENVISNAP
jgi:hypothetical protein